MLCDWRAWGADPGSSVGCAPLHLSSHAGRYATFGHLAGAADLTDAAAVAEGLPAVDSLNMWGMITGEASASPR